MRGCDWRGKRWVGWRISIVLALEMGAGVSGLQISTSAAFAEFEKSSDQVLLPEIGREELSKQAADEEAFPMGWGGYLNLVNGSPSDWVVGRASSYQMPGWQWPTVQAGKASKVYVEFGTSGHVLDDAGEAYYNIAGTSDKFTVLARKPSITDYKLTISLDGVSTNQSPKGSQVDLGFKHDGAVNWIMSKDEAGKWWSNSGPVGAYSDWMQQSMGSLANRTLRHICMPGSHDAGMGPAFKPGTVGSHFANTQTQYLDIAGQLMAGSRYFDLRPVISNGQWVSGHYSKLGDIWVGGNGQSIASIIQQINDFTSKHQELIILNLSHTLDTDHEYRDLTQAQWNSLFDTLKALTNRFISATPGSTDFSTYKLGEFIQDRASIFTIAQLPGGISLGPYATQGFYSPSNFPFYDQYSNTNSRATLKTDQLAKLASNRNIPAGKSTFHILSWTLTQQAEDVLNFDRAIMNLAADALDDLVSEAWGAFTPESFPNVLYVDALGVRERVVVPPWVRTREVGVVSDVAALAVGVNNWVVGRGG